MNDLLFTYDGQLFPDYLKRGNAAQFITPIAQKFCKGRGIDVGAGKWPMPDALPVDIQGYDDSCSAMELPTGPIDGKWDYIFSSHCLEHLADPVGALWHWHDRLRRGGVLFLYLPHPDMGYWRPQNCRKHRHLFWPDDTARMVRDVGFTDVLHSERDLAWGFAVVGFRGPL